MDPEIAEIPLSSLSYPVDSPPSEGQDQGHWHTPTEQSNSQPQISNTHRYLLSAIFCLANLLDGYNLNALFVALPVLAPIVGLNEPDSSWVMSAFQLTYAAFLLMVSQ